jgi:hypothetical protein
MASSFFKKGYSDKPNLPKKEFQPRHWMPAPDEGEKPDPKEDATHMIIIHRGEPVGFWEHQVKLNGDWRNWFSCPLQNEVEDECPLCEHGEYRAYFAGAMTGLDITPFETKDGVNQGRRKLIVAKNEMLGRFELWASEDGAEEGSLYGVQYRILRSSSDAANIGDDWKKKKLWTPEDLEAHFEEVKDALMEADWDGAEEEAENLLEPYDYDDWFEHKTMDELRAVAAALGTPSKKKKGKRSRGKKGVGRKKSKSIDY